MSVHYLANETLSAQIEYFRLKFDAMIIIRAGSFI